MMKIGVTFPQTEIGPEPTVVRDYAQAVEAMGFDYLLAFDHVLGANPDRPGGWSGPYTHETMFHEIFVLFGYLAAVTQRIELVSGIVILPQRQTVLVAKQAAEVDVLSGGRLRLGVGLGWNEVEYIGLNENFHNRGKRSEEQIQVLRALWAEPLVKFEGQYHHIADAGLNPLPVRRSIPVWIGASQDVAIQRAARIADGWIANPMPLDQLRTRLDLVWSTLAQAGRSRDDFGVDFRFRQSAGEPEGGWAAHVAQLEALGVTHVSLDTMRAGFTSIDQHLDAVRRFREATR
jgi:probable F420-dependent oxidoreductase